MGKLKVAMYEQGEYMQALAAYFNKKTFLLECRLFTRWECLVDFLKEQKVDVLLLGQDEAAWYILDEEVKSQVRQRVILSEGDCVAEAGNEPVLFRYQSAEQILEELLQIVSMDTAISVVDAVESIQEESAEGGVRGDTGKSVAEGEVMENTVWKSMAEGEVMENTVWKSMAEGGVVESTAGKNVTKRGAMENPTGKSAVKGGVMENPAGKNMIWEGAATEFTAVYLPTGDTQILQGIWNRQNILQDKCLYISLEPFSGMPEAEYQKEVQGMSELIFYLCKKADRLTQKLRAMIQEQDGMHYIAPVKDYRDLYNLQREDIDALLAVLAQDTVYDRVVFHIGFWSDAMLYLMYCCDRVLFPQAQSSWQQNQQKAMEKFMLREGMGEVWEQVEYVV